MEDFELESMMSVLIKMYFNEVELSSGTGFFVDTEVGPVLITNRHNVTGRHNETGKCLSKTGAIPNIIEIYHHEKNNEGSAITKSENLYHEEDPLWIEHPHWGQQVDFVALKLTDTKGVNIYSYSLDAGSDMKIGIGEVVSVIGFPFGLQVGRNFAIWATGFIASEPSIDYKKLPLFLVDCRTRQGQSGSAVIAYRPSGGILKHGGSIEFIFGSSVKFFGIYSGRVNDQSDLGLVWKASAIKELVESINIEI